MGRSRRAAVLVAVRRGGVQRAPQARERLRAQLGRVEKKVDLQAQRSDALHAELQALRGNVIGPAKNGRTYGRSQMTGRS